MRNEYFLLSSFFLLLSLNFSSSEFNRKKTNKIKSKFNGKWIVTLLEECSHRQFSAHLEDYFHSHQLQDKPIIVHEYKHVLYGVTVKGIKENELKDISCVKSYVKDTVKRLVSVPSWGLDRIDQESLPLNNIYDSFYTGQNVDGNTLFYF